MEEAKESLEPNVEETTSVIKENHFYKIIEVDAPEYIEPEPEIQVSYKDEVDQQLTDMENKYEDLLQKTKEGYQSQLNKMVSDFSDFRNHINQQVTRMSFISSSSAGGGAVRILDMDDVDTSELADGKTLLWSHSAQKFELKASVVQNAKVFEITQQNIDDGYVELETTSAADPELYHLSTVEVNGLVNYYPFQYTFLSETRVDISLLGVQVGDYVRVVYTRK